MNPNNYTIFQVVRWGFFFTSYGFVKYLPSPLFDPLRFLVLKLFAKKIQSMRIKDGVTIWFPEGVSIGRHCSLNEWVFINGYGGVKIGNDVRIAHGASIVSEDHGMEALDVPIRSQKKIRGEITIGDDVWVGMGVRITRGVSIGRGAVLAAGAVVTRDIPEYAIAAGVPAKVIRFRGAASQSTGHGATGDRAG